MNRIINLQDVNKYYGIHENQNHVLKNINLVVEKGEFVSILGASGSGKSTLMNIIGCMDVMSSGKYKIDNIDVSKMNDDELATIRNNKIGFIFQKYQLIPQYSILQNVMLPLLVKGYSMEEAKLEAIQGLKDVGLEEKLNSKPNQLSGGQQQRVAIARALITKPELLLADEPTGALDKQTGIEILELFIKLNKEGNTIVQITHDAHVAKYASRIVNIEDGYLLKNL